MKYKISRPGPAGSLGTFYVEARNDREAREKAIQFMGAIIFDDAWLKVVHVQSTRQVQVEEDGMPTDEEVERMLEGERMLEDEG